MTGLVAVSNKQEFTAHAEKLLACTNPTRRLITDPATVEYRKSKMNGHLIQIEYSTPDCTADNVIRAIDLTDGTVILEIR